MVANALAGALSFTFTSDTLVDRIITPVIVLPPFDPNVGAPHPGIPAKALWDTGATKSVITPSIAVRLGLQPTGKVETHTAGGVTTNLTYIVSIGLPNRTLITGVQVSDCANLNGFEALIGMDIIRMGDFAITNVAGKTTMSFRCPSVARIDYVEESNRLALATVGRNDPCPCGMKKPDGSPKKFKHCCALAMQPAV